MAISTTNYFSNAIVGVPQVGADVDIYALHKLPKFALGTKFERQDGAVFRYANFGAVNAVGCICGKNANETDNLSALVLTASAASEQQNGDPIGTYPNAAGSKYLSCVFAAGTSANQFAGGYVTISGITGVGATYRIKSHTATGTPSSGHYLVELYDRLVSSLAATSRISISGSKFNDLMPSVAGTQSAIVAGVSMVACTTAGYYGWVQTKGIVGVLSAGTMVSGQPAVVSSTSGNAVSYTHLTLPTNREV